MKKILLGMCFFASLAISAQVTYESTNGGASGSTGGSFKWNDALNWVIQGTSTNGIPTINDDVVIINKIEIGRNSTAALAKTITCSGSGQLYFRENSSLTVTGNVTLSKSNDAITFYAQSAAGGTGYKTGTMIFGGTYTSGKKTVIRKRLSDSKWHLIGMPFLNARVDHTTESTNSYLRDNGSVLSLASYDTATDSYTYYTNVTPLGSGSKFGTAQGYSISVSDATSKDDYYATGTQHSGDVSYTLSTAGNGFNLLGNPYISYLHANDAADGTNNLLRINGANGSNILAEDTIWLWDADGEAWVTKVLGDASFRINPLQGFFVKASSASAFSFTKGDMESHTETDAF